MARVGPPCTVRSVVDQMQGRQSLDLPRREHPLAREETESVCSICGRQKGPGSLAKIRLSLFIWLLPGPRRRLREAEPIATGPCCREGNGHAILPEQLALPALSPHQL